MTCIHFLHYEFHVNYTHNHVTQIIYGVNFVVASITKLVINNN
jgi:hypothetical protein